jgi:hypothetical protein
MAIRIGTGKAAEVVGLKELVARLRDLQGKFDGKEVYDVLRQGAGIGEWEMRRSAQDRGWPHEVANSLFAFARPAAGKPTAALYGVRKRGRARPWAPAYVEWGKRAGKPLGESLATMFEYGTSKMRARPAVRPAITAARPAILAAVAEGLRRLISGAGKP